VRCISAIGVRAQSTLGGTFLPEKYVLNARILHDHDSCPKNYQNTGIFMIFARKIYKIPEFYIIIAREIFFPEF